MNNKERSVISWIAEFAGEKKPYYIGSVAFAFAEQFCGLAPYYIMGIIVKDLLEGVREPSVYLKLLLVMTLFWLLKSVLHGCSTTLSHAATFQVLANIRKRVLDKLSRMPLGDVLQRSSGTLKSTIVERVDSIETTLAHVIPEFSSNLAAPLFIFIYLLTVDWRMALVSLITLPVGAISMMLMTRDADVWGTNAINKTKILNDTAVEYINGIEVIKVFGKTESSYEKFVIAAREGADCFIEWMRKYIFHMGACMSITPATMITVLPIGGFFFMRGSLSAVDFLQIIILSIGLLAPLITAMSYSDDISKVGVILGEVTELMLAPELDRPQQSNSIPDGNSIRLENVRFGYGETEILHGVDLTIPEGCMTALVGPSGSGKSTIARLIAGLWDVKEGVITIGGADLRDISLKDHADMIAYVSQDNYLFDESIRENIRKGRMSATDEEVEEAAKMSGCHEFIMSLENGYDTIVGGAGGHLSGGERQRIAIARAMLRNAPVVILDEATAYTDPENEAIVQASVAKLIQGKTLLVIAHRLSTIQDADQIVVVRDGKIDGTGSHEELLKENELYRNMWEAHVSVRDEALSPEKGTAMKETATKGGGQVA